MSDPAVELARASAHHLAREARRLYFSDYIQAATDAVTLHYGDVPGLVTPMIEAVLELLEAEDALACDINLAGNARRRMAREAAVQ
jgi:acetyl-CoA carboxylase alpha subunit